MEGWQKGAGAVLKMSGAGKGNYFKNFPERKEWFQSNFPEHFGRSVAAATTSLKKVTKAKQQKQRLAIIRQVAEKQNRLKVSSDAVRAMGTRRRESGEGLGGGLETNRDIIKHAAAGNYIKSGGLGSLFEAKTGVYSEDGNWYYNSQLFPSEEEARAAEESDKEKVGASKEAIDKFETDIKNLAFTAGPGENAARAGAALAGSLGSGGGIEKGRDWTEKDKDPNWGAVLGMKNGWMNDKDEQYAIIKTPPAGSEINTRGKRLPFSTIVQGGDMPVDQAKKRGGYYTGRNMEELSKVNEESDNMNDEKNQLSQVAKKLAVKVMEEKRLQEECMPMKMSMESKPHAKEAEDEPGEYDYEGDMAKSQLRSIGYNAKMLHDMLEDNTNLPEWVQSKITLAEDYILTAANYMRSEMNMNEEVEQVDEGRFRRSMQGYRVLGGYGYGNKLRYQSSGERSREINVGLDDKQEKENARRADEADDKDLPFDPNATRPEMPAGKQPAEYRYVRNLARNAMKAGIAATADDLVAQHNAIHTVDEEVDTNDLVPRSMLPSKSVIPPGKGFGDDIKREKIMQKTVKAIQKKKAALPTNNPSENELVPQSMLPDDPAASYPPGYIVPEPIPTVPAVPAAAKGQKPIIKEEDESPFVSSASKFLTRTSARLVYGDKND